MSEYDFLSLIENPDYTRKKLLLPNGRIISYAEAGAKRHGFPVLFHIGLMGSSIAAVAYHKDALERKLWIIMLDYPGVGESTFQENRTLEDWPRDVDSAMDIILGGQGKPFVAWGHSMGGPNALALVADEALRARISALVLAGPWLAFDDTTMVWLARSMPSFVQNELIPRTITSTSTLSISMAGSVGSMHHTNDHAAFIKAVTSYARYQGQKGNRQMVRLATQEHIVLPSHVDIPIEIFCGSNDGVSTPALCERLKSGLATECGCNEVKLTLLDGGDHTNIAMPGEYIDTILDRIKMLCDQW